MMVPTLISVSVIPGSFLQGFGALMGLRLSNCALGSVAPAAPVASNPTLAAARTEIPATARTHRCAFIDSPHVSRRTLQAANARILARPHHKVHAGARSVGSVQE